MGATAQTRGFVGAVAIPIASMQLRDVTASQLEGVAAPSWLSKESVDERMNVWVAVGMSMERLQLNNADRLRS